jgi:LysR family glycine cleavage system transcriptional activator
MICRDGMTDCMAAAMPRRLPSIRALGAFEAAGRHLNFTHAAAELNLTQGAISHRVADLEAHLGVRLFQRLPQGLELTAAGQGYLPVVREALARLHAGAQALEDEYAGRGVLTVSVSPNFAAKWLVPRLGAFLAAQPDIDLRISAAKRHVDLVADGVDLVVRHGAGQWPGLRAVRLCTEALFPVCGPRLMEGPRALRAPRDLARCVLLHDRDRQGWARWLAAAGLSDVDAGRGPLFDQTSMAIDAAIAGQGVALARTALAAADLLGGRLVRPFALTLPAPFAYWIVCLEGAAGRRKIALFRDWLLAEAAADAERLERLWAPAPSPATALSAQP